MKNVITVLLILISTVAFPQKKDTRPFIISEQSHDTLEIRDTSIHFIKIGNDVYEIIRKVELKKSEPATFIWGGSLGNPFITPAIQNYTEPKK